VDQVERTRSQFQKCQVVPTACRGVCMCVCARADACFPAYLSLCRAISDSPYPCCSFSNFPALSPSITDAKFCSDSRCLVFLRLGPFGHVCVDPPSVRVSSEMGVALSSCV